jgi:hypothetical protein
LRLVALPASLFSALVGQQVGVRIVLRIVDSESLLLRGRMLEDLGPALQLLAPVQDGQTGLVVFCRLVTGEVARVALLLGNCLFEKLQLLGEHVSAVSFLPLVHLQDLTF